MQANDGLLSRNEALSGRLGRQPSRLLSLIEMRSAYMRAESRRVIEAYFLSDRPEFTRQSDLDYFQSIMRRAQSPHRLTVGDLERYAAQWQMLVPNDPALRAAVIHLLADKYSLTYEATPKIRAALGCADQAVQAAFQLAYGQPLEAVFSAAAGPGAPADRAGIESANEAALRDAEATLEWLVLPGGAVLFREGEDGDSLYILVSGRLRVGVAHEGGERTVAELGRGEMVGEMGVLTGEKRSTTVYAIRDSELVKLPQAAMNHLAEKYPQVMTRVNRILANRLRLELGPKRITSTVMTFAIVPVNANLPLANFTRRLAQGLAGYDSTLHLSRAQVDSELGPGAAQTPQDDADNSRVAGWLSEQESNYRYVVYEADAGLSHWTRRCIRQADRVLMVALASADPTPGEIEKQMECMNATARAELVLLHPASARRPVSTRNWLSPRCVRAHHHVRLDDAEDLQRLVRRLTGHALGLVLGGGGARSYAHIGVYRALTEAGLQVDLVGGTSMGSLIGAALAMNMDEPAMIELAQEISSRKTLFDLTLPLVSFFASHKVTNVMRKIFEDIQIEDLWKPFFCVSSNLTRATPMVHRQGPVWQSVRASSAVPGIFSPILCEGDLLVDGAMLNNLPIDVMHDLSQGGAYCRRECEPGG
jgi:CRP-like cAMP-binding protein